MVPEQELGCILDRHIAPVCFLKVAIADVPTVLDRHGNVCEEDNFCENRLMLSVVSRQR